MSYTKFSIRAKAAPSKKNITDDGYMYFGKGSMYYTRKNRAVVMGKSANDFVVQLLLKEAKRKYPSYDWKVTSLSSRILTMRLR